MSLTSFSLRALGLVGEVGQIEIEGGSRRVPVLQRMPRWPFST